MFKPLTRSHDILETKNHNGNKKSSNTKTYATEEKPKEQKQT